MMMWPWRAIAVALVVVGSYVFTAQQRQTTDALYVSDLFNSSYDTPLLLLTRWSVWWSLAVPFVVPMRQHGLGVRTVVASVVVWVATIVSGVYPSVFAEVAPPTRWQPPALRAMHLLGATLILVCSGILLFATNLRLLGVLSSITGTVGLVLFANGYNLAFLTIEYVLLAVFGVGMLLRPLVCVPSSSSSIRGHACCCFPLWR